MYLLSLLLAGCEPCQDETCAVATDDTEAVDTVDTEVVDTDVVDTDVVDTDALDTDVVDTDALDTVVVDTDTGDNDVVDTDVVDTDALDTDTPDSDAPDSDALDTDALDTDTPDSDVSDSDALDTDGIDTDARDTSVIDTDLPLPLPGFGAIQGDCGVLDDVEWVSPSAYRFRNAIDFGTTAWDPSLLSPGGQEMWAAGTLGGSSGESEAIAFDLLYRCEIATLLKPEPEILYDDPGGKKTDILVSIDGRKVGVSVTRALTFVFPEPCAAVDEAALDALMLRKVGDLQLSEANASAADEWERSMLYVIACDEAHGDATIAAFDSLDPGVRGDAILMVAVSDGDDAFIY